MDIKKIAIIEPNLEQAGHLSNWLKGKGYDIRLITDYKKAPDELTKEKVDLILMDVWKESLDVGEVQRADIEFAFAVCRTLKSNPNFSEVTVVFITSKRDIKSIQKAIESGADDVIAMDHKEGIITESMETFFDKLRIKSKRVLDLNLVNFLIQIVTKASREDFFTIAPVIINHLILDKFRPIIGEPAISMILSRINSVIGGQYKFIANIKYQDGHILMDDMEKASKEISTQQLSFAFRDYIYAFIHLVRTLTSDILIERWEEERTA